MTRMRNGGRALIAVLLLLTGGCDFAGVDPVGNTDFIAAEPFRLTLSADGIAALRVAAINGEITIVGSATADSIVATGERRVGSDSQEDAERHLHDLTVSLRQLNDQATLATDQPDRSGGRDYTVDYRIVMPAAMALTFEHVNGDVQASGLQGEVAMSLVNGTLDVETSVKPARPLDLSVVNGQILLGIPASTSADFEAHVVNGSIGLTNLQLDDFEGTTRSMTGRLGGGGIQIALDVVNGTILVRGL
ncbi:MAG: hypothetical protein R2834_22720 [Rhodothermales bacterium]